MPSNNTPETSILDNPHFKNADRALPEISELLRRLPADFLGTKPASPDSLLIAEAAANHASNANETLLSGLDAIGKLLVSAGLNDDAPVESNQIAEIGALISHLAVEAQFMQETEANLCHKLSEQKRSGS